MENKEVVGYYKSFLALKNDLSELGKVNGVAVIGSTGTGKSVWVSEFIDYLNAFNSTRLDEIFVFSCKHDGTFSKKDKTTIITTTENMKQHLERLLNDSDTTYKKILVVFDDFYNSSEFDTETINLIKKIAENSKVIVTGQDVRQVAGDLIKELTLTVGLHCDKPAFFEKNFADIYPDKYPKQRGEFLARYRPQSQS